MLARFYSLAPPTSAAGSCTDAAYILRAAGPNNTMQPLDAATAAALEEGLTVRIAYASGYSHRLCLEPPQPPPSGNALKHLLHELARRPIDEFAEATVPAAESLLRGIARRHGSWRAWKDEAAYLQWLTR